MTPSYVGFPTATGLSGLSVEGIADRFAGGASISIDASAVVVSVVIS
jgi:hypothetical protein